MAKPKIFANLHVLPMRVDDLDFLAFQKLEPEFYFSGDDIDEFSPEKLEAYQQEVVKRSFQPIWHAPFLDLDLGAQDQKIRRVSEERVLWAIRTAKQFGAKQVVVHAGFGPWTWGNHFPRWLERAKPTLSTLVAKAAEGNIRLAFENIFDTTPEDLAALIDLFPKETVGICLDMGHFNLFSESSIKSWLDILGPRIFEIHLHDNHGGRDDHIAVGDGTIKFGGLVQWLNAREQMPILTLEMEQRTHIIKSVNRVRDWFEVIPE